MNSQLNHNTSTKMYRLTNIEKTNPPEGMPAGNWYHYVVEYGNSTMNCIRAGTLTEVTQHAEAFVENLNSRSAIGYSGYAARKAKT
ncbi:MAG: hypothetical protein OQL09_06925 [Gammaproteobacteria bacterium]|nr:hypothetical protein [Gammaproteobacteria bacterium]